MTQTPQAKRSPLNGDVGESSGDVANHPVEASAELRETRRLYRFQLDSLREEAEFEEIGINESSVSAFWSFVEEMSKVRVAEIFFTDSGDLSAEWRTGHDHHFELRFLGNNRVNYVYFNRHPGESDVSRGYGVEHQSRVNNLLEALDLQSLVCT